MTSPRIYKPAFITAFALALFFLIMLNSGRSASMASGIINLLMTFSSLACGFLGLGAWLYTRARGRASIPVMYGIGVGTLFALGASIIVLMAIKAGLLMALLPFAVSAALSLALSGGAVLLFAALRGDKKPVKGLIGGLLVLASLIIIYFIALP